MVDKIDPRSPGKSTAGDQFCDPYGRVGSMANSGHENLSRRSDGSFDAMPQGGVSSHGDDMVEKYRPGRRAVPRSDNPVPAGSNLNDEGTGYAPDDDRDYSAPTVNRSVTTER